MSWEDKTLYWAWRGADKESGKPPTQKRINYATVTLSNKTSYQLAVGVWDDDKYTEINQAEVDWLNSVGAEVK